MKLCTQLLHAALAIAGVFVTVGSAEAAQRTFVASAGSDLNPCTLPAPCRSFGTAIAATSSGGEVIVLDSAGYGPVTITVPVTINAPAGVYAGITVGVGLDGITVAAGATDKVVLRGLTINNLGGNSGILVNTAGEVHVENCVINGMGTGIRAMPAAPLKLVVSDTTVRDSISSGINVQAQAGGEASRVEIWRSVVADGASDGIKLFNVQMSSIGDTLVGQNAGVGVSVSSTAVSSVNPNTAIDRTQIVGNTQGISANGTNPGNVISVVSVSHSVIANNALQLSSSGVAAFNKSLVQLMDNQITGNTTGTVVSGGVISSVGTNMRAQNGTDGPAATPITPF